MTEIILHDPFSALIPTLAFLVPPFTHDPRTSCTGSLLRGQPYVNNAVPKHSLAREIILTLPRVPSVQGCAENAHGSGYMRVSSKSACSERTPCTVRRFLELGTQDCQMRRILCIYQQPNGLEKRVLFVYAIPLSTWVLPARLFLRRRRGSELSQTALALRVCQGLVGNEEC